ncbi:hypothetical protein MAR_011902, partial [Mya arenaria]
MYNGYYCTDSSVYETGGPTGTYNYEEGMTALSDCQNCPINHFNHLTGQTGCFYCGGEAQQPLTGQPTCQCSGNGRDFQEISGDNDCERDVMENCKNDEYRFQNGTCKNAAEFEYTCKYQYCGEEKYLGFYAQKRIWTRKVDNLEAMCNVACRKASAHLAFIDNNVKTNITGNATQDSTYNHTGQSRLLATTMLSGVNYTGIANPIVCLEYADFMMWAVDNNNYPIYDRNNQFNTNSQFDYGGFRALAEAQARVGTSTTLFAYQFKDPGTCVLQQCRP